jgi:hypothetical protein
MMYHQPTKGRLKMPSGWHAGAHHVRNFGNGDGTLTLRCKCGWETPATYKDAEDLAAEHMAQFPSDDHLFVVSATPRT